MQSIENNTRISLFVTELYLRNRVSDHHVTASSRHTGIWLSHVDDPVVESASECFGFALWHKEFNDLSLFVLARSSLFRASQYTASQWIPILYTASGRHYFQSFDIFYQHLSLHVNHFVYAPVARR